jgi:hypothetical protein
MTGVRTLLDTGFPDDDGSADPDLTTALTAYAAGGSRLAALQVLQHTRLLVPVVAVLGEVERGEDGLDRDKSSDMATVLVTGPGGKKGLLAFTSSETMARWDPGARPVPVTASVAAQAAIQDGADAVVVDMAGPVTFPVEGETLASLAQGHVLTKVTTQDGERYAWVRVQD